MDGVGETYESIRGRAFCDLLKRVEKLKQITLFGINYVVNSQTMKDLPKAVEIASDIGASEFLLLPEEPVKLMPGIDEGTMRILIEWIENYKGSLPMFISESRAGFLSTCDPLKSETALMAYAHIDAEGCIKINSYESQGVFIEKTGIVDALQKLKFNLGK
ncbi:hypothetical protein llg_17750 [Luteolibacter sp. LG18]|nr:hypothetical protein llg_17750 [Luteolibacter sp. LG18]